MIPRTVPTWQIKNWQEELKHLIQCPKTLLQLLNLGEEWLAAAELASEQFPLRATASYVARIEKGNINDPLLRQILPIGAELVASPGYSKDPLQENQFNPVPGVVHKYRSRALFIAATQCAINCRYCFRRHFPYEDNQLSRQDWQKALDYVARTPEINEIILSGGDPLSLGDKQLKWLTDQIAAIPHIRRLRVHTRYPIILPSRITPELIASLSAPNIQTVVVIHCNHANEIDAEVGDSLAQLKAAGITLLNQSVLLRGINDKTKILASLSEALFARGVLPYYLHLLDPVAGAAHFAVSDRAAKTIYRDLLSSLPGFLVPKLVRETPHEHSKTPIGLD